MNVERRQRREVLSNLGESADLEELHDVLHWRNRTEDVSANDIVIGEVPINEFTEDELGKVKEDLRNVCKKLKTNLDDRLRKSDIMRSAQHTLTGSFEWYNFKDYLTDQGQVVNFAKERLSDLAEKIGKEWQDIFNENTFELVNGYISWINLCIESRELNTDISDESL